MKILHTSDWHLGKKLKNGKDRLDEQKLILEEIAGICKANSVDIVCVAGDIFDVYTPPSEAEEVFYDGILKIAGQNERLVIIIAGNHDDPLRLSAAENLAAKHGIIIVKGFDYKAKVKNGESISIIKSDIGGLIAENKSGEKCAIAYLPYPTDTRSNEVVLENESYSDKIKRWLKGTELFSKDSFNIILSHLFTAGAKVAGDERSIEVGGAKAVHLSAFSESADFIMLGHIHKRQNINASRNIEYCGAIMQYTFEETDEKGVSLLTIENNKIAAKEYIPLKSAKKLFKLEADSLEDAIIKLEKNNGCFIELKLKLQGPLTYAENKMLRTAHPGIVNIILQIEKENMEDIKSVRHLNRTDLFIAFWKNKYDKKPDNDVLELYQKLVEGKPDSETISIND